MSKKIHGLLGPICTDELGSTLIHEHIITCCDWSLRKGLGHIYCEDNVLYNMAVKKLRQAKDNGINTIVDGTPIDLGRDIQLLRRAAEETGVQIIASTGFYYGENAVLLWKNEEEIFRLLYKDCTEGMSDTDSLPGIVKCAVDWKGFTDYVCKILRVSGKISASLQLPVFCHTIPELEQGHRVLDILANCGVPPQAIVIGHSGDTDNIDYLVSLAEKGCYIGFDRFGIENKNPATHIDSRIDTLFRFCSLGFSDRVLVSHDYSPYTGFFPDWEECKRQEFLESPVDYNYFSRFVVPALLEKGVDKQDIFKMTVTNPRCFFENAY